MENKINIVYTSGSFDLFHHGHANLLRHCSKIGFVVVSLNTDKFIEKYKGKPPIMKYDEREKALLSCKWVDKVVPNVGGADSKPAIELVKPDFIVVGSDWAGKDYYSQMQFTQEWLDERDITLLYVPYTLNISTTNIKKRIMEL